MTRLWTSNLTRSPQQSPHLKKVSETLHEPPKDIPVNIYGAIFWHVEKHDLTVLARVSLDFQHEAEAILYLQVNLCHPKYGRDQVISWCTAVTNVQRRAHRVDLLKFPATLAQQSISDAPLNDIDQLISGAFNAIVNLKHLFILGVGEPHPPSLHPSTLKQVTFRLRSLAGDARGFGVESMWELIAKQPDIEYWVPTQPFLEASTSFPENSLTRLRQTVIVKAERTVCLVGRPIEALVLVVLEPLFSRELGSVIMTPLKSLATLHTLVCTHASLRYWSAADMIRCIAENAPGLVSLSLGSFAAYSSTTPSQGQEDLVEACSNLKKLSVLILNTNMTALYLPAHDDLDHTNPLETAEEWGTYSLNPGNCRRIATGFFTSCTQLSTLSFPFKLDTSLSSNNSGGSMTYTRSFTDHRLAKFDGFYTVDTSEWWMR